MAYYSWYQQQQPGWGTPQYQFVAPPAPAYSPQPYWSGSDYYLAHANANDNSLFDYVWSRMKAAVIGSAVGREEARHWHRRVYGGLTDMSSLLPTEIGAAAGYEAIRLWEYHKAIYRQPLSDDVEREREALAGLAVAEAVKLWQYTGRHSDKYGRREAGEVAAATAERIFERKYDLDGYEQYDSYPSLRRRRSFSARYPDQYDDYGSMSGAGYYAPGTPGMTYAQLPGASTYVQPVQSVQYAAAASPYGQTYVAASPSAGYAVPFPQTGAAYSPTGYYPGAGVGLPVPAQQLVIPQTHHHHRTYSQGSYGYTRPAYI